MTKRSLLARLFDVLGLGARPQAAGSKPVRLIAFYLPQFHPIPENDAWWGAGFTEWRNVAKARPLFPGHLQPRLPADLGFYDLRLPETRSAQAELARAHGVDGFCYWHYWFHGKRLLERPFNEVLSSGAPDFPFCLAWANEPWSRTWLGREEDVLMPQTYSEADDEAHAEWLADAFADRRYIRVGDRPVFLVYSPRHHPDIARFLDALRRSAARRRIPAPFFIGMNSHSLIDHRPLGFDANLKFEPQLGALPLALDDHANADTLKANNRALGLENCALRIFDYAQARTLMEQFETAKPAIPCVMAGYDNSPRRSENGIIIVNNTPQAFGAALTQAVEANRRAMPENELIFINAWNEWAEGNCLEPDLANGRGFLEAVRDVKRALAPHRRR